MAAKETVTHRAAVDTFETFFKVKIRSRAYISSYKEEQIHGVPRTPFLELLELLNARTVHNALKNLFSFAR